ncbi:hypothetical protein [Stenotrophomonas maltophilia]|uniref:hypothetical protein n=1 Tax=Stenotrophomonas maltophilia TaxID=40324 RepID=UPI0012D985FC|nr:hypothetical protein [Stenotrophomonas maltophilia]
MSPLAWSVLSFFLGAFLGHRLSLGRDRRKEFNEAAVPVRQFVLSQLAAGYPVTPPSKLEVDSFAQRLRPWERRAFRDALHVVESAFSSTDYNPERGAFDYLCSDDLEPALRKLQSLSAIK